MDQRSAEREVDEIVRMRVTLDRDANVGYIYFTAIKPGEAKYQYVCDAPYIAGDVILDFSADGRLLGVELLSVDQQLPRDVIERLRSEDTGGSAKTRWKGAGESECRSPFTNSP